jgi:hypothetical protein
MHLLAISLLTILAGTLLLAKFRKDTPGKFFTYISWFFIVVGFILFIGAIGGGICKMTHHGFGGRHDCRQEMMMKDYDHGMPGCCYCPKGMDNEMCCKKQGSISQDSTMEGCSKHMEGRPEHMMKGCPGHMERDSTKMPAQKE